MSRYQQTALGNSGEGVLAVACPVIAVFAALVGRLPQMPRGESRGYAGHDPAMIRCIQMPLASAQSVVLQGVHRGAVCIIDPT